MDTRHYEARKLTLVPKDDSKFGRWDYVVLYQGNVHAVGYCGEAGGGHHEKREECFTCYRDFLLDGFLTTHLGRLEELEDDVCAREGCGAMAVGIAQVEGIEQVWGLCTDHLNKESMKVLLTEGIVTSNV
jgi:hypothetical protein